MPDCNFFEGILLDNLKTNIDLSPSDIALMVSRIKVPENMALMGVLPILAILFGTDDATQVIYRMSLLDSDMAKRISEKVQASIMDPAYPFSSSVWQFNDPDSDISALDEALNDLNSFAMHDFEAYASLYSDTLPFINVAYEEMDPASVLNFTSNAISAAPGIENPCAEPATEARHRRDLGPSAVIIPSVAVGSLVLLSSKLKETREVEV